MKKIFSQLTGAAAVVAAVSAGLAYAQVSPSPSASMPANTQPVDQRMNTGTAAAGTTTTTTVTPPRSEDLKSSSTDSRYGAGANNGSTYNPAIRSTELKPGNVSSVDEPAVTTTTTTTPAAATPPAAMPMQSSTMPDNGTTSVTPTPAPATGTTDGNWNADGTRAARADRN